MKRYAGMAALLAGLVLVSFLVVEGLGIPLFTDPSDRITQGDLLAALIGSGLLLADVFIPVPSSLIMIAHGAAFGVFWGGLLSLVAVVGGALLGWAIGRRGKKWMDRLVTPEERARAQRFIWRYGMVAIILSRMLPILAETVAIMAGAMGLGGKRFFLACVLGSLPPALIYAIAGTVATDFASGSLVAAVVFLLAGLGWWFSRRFLPPQAAHSEEAESSGSGQ